LNTTHDLKSIIKYNYLIIGSFAWYLHGFTVKPEDVDIWLGIDTRDKNWRLETNRINDLCPRIGDMKIQFGFNKYGWSRNLFTEIHEHHSLDTKYGRIPTIPILKGFWESSIRDKDKSRLMDFSQQFNNTSFLCYFTQPFNSRDICLL
jgi:hypothetical protein